MIDLCCKVCGTLKVSCRHPTFFSDAIVRDQIHNHLFKTLKSLTWIKSLVFSFTYALPFNIKLITNQHILISYNINWMFICGKKKKNPCASKTIQFISIMFYMQKKIHHSMVTIKVNQSKLNSLSLHENN